MFCTVQVELHYESLGVRLVIRYRKQNHHKNELLVLLTTKAHSTIITQNKFEIAYEQTGFIIRVFFLAP